ncbi:MAG: 3-dehydroquinate synthase [Ruminococcaceae bacterium]|nr:3-dehydroquinate synthase [Oscillospiraceae bacterium]
MQIIKVNTSTEYEVHIGKGLLCRAGEKIRALFPNSKVMLVSDDIVFSLYGEKTLASLTASGLECSHFVFKNGEERKRLSTVEDLLESLADGHFTRSDIIVALGGGVVGDMAGFAASVFCRGIKYVQIPTTLLAAVDSSVGGKTAVDLSRGKNLCGAFWQPSLVLCDTDTLATLKDLDVQNGLSEMLKYGVICNKELFEKVKNYKENDMAALIARCVEIKRDIVSGDEFDRGNRMLLNLGHTIGHAVEAASNFAVTHGHGVAIGLAIVARAAEKMGMAKAGMANEICHALSALSLPTSTSFDTDTLAALTLSDKKSSGDSISLIVPLDIGNTVIHKVKRTEVKNFIEVGR